MKKRISTLLVVVTASGSLLGGCGLFGDTQKPSQKQIKNEKQRLRYEAEAEAWENLLKRMRDNTQRLRSLDDSVDGELVE